MVGKIIIIGAGPTGLGAAYRLKELGYDNWEILERNSYIGGLAASFKDKEGFTWDIGGHVLFSHYEYVDKVVDKLLGQEHLVHQRDAWIWLMSRWVPYPFQNNIRHLPKDQILECLMGLIKVNGTRDLPSNFKEWNLRTFGTGIAKYFMLPYNSKVWAYPLELMSQDWIAERVSVVNIEKILRNIVYEQDEKEWGPNSQFKFPLHGGTGGLFNRFMPYIKDHLTLNEEMIELDLDERVARFDSGKEVAYDVLVTTVPLDQFIHRMRRPRNDLLAKAAQSLRHNGVLSVGIGIKKPCPSKKCWVYFPEADCCFYRVTYFSNYSPNNVPDPNDYYSLICETSYSDFKPEDKRSIVERTIEGLIKTNIISETDKNLITTTHVVEADHAYPIPTLERDKSLGTIQPFLQKRGVFSTGRFGAWKYEVGNMDHSIMHGVEVIDRILRLEDN